MAVPAPTSSKLIFAPGSDVNDVKPGTNGTDPPPPPDPDRRLAHPGRAPQFTKSSLSLPSLSQDPFTQFHAWYTDAQKVATAGAADPYTVVLSTAHLPSGRVSARVLYLKELDTRGFVVYSNWGTSRKAADVATNAWVALTFHWRELERQVRVEGTVERLSAAESQAYFDTRARGSRIGAWASRQSTVLLKGGGGGNGNNGNNSNGDDNDDGREELERRVQEVEDRFDGVEKIPVPEFWGGMRVLPVMVEFWQGRENRLHDRFVYEKKKEEEDRWKIERLSP